MGMTQKAKIIGVCVAIVAAILVWTFVNRSKTETDAEETSAAQKGETVAAVAKVQRGPIEEKLVIAGAFKPFQEVDVHAKVAGYIKTIYVDVGDHVKEGQTLAVLEIPELAAELAGADASVRRSKEEIRRAQGDVERSKSAHAASHSMYERLKQAAQQKSGLVAQQELDDAQAKDLEQEAQVSSSQAALSAAEQQLQVAEANQKQYNALSNYSRIVAPFAGVVTTRYADTGALIAAGTSSSTQSMPIVKLTQVSKLRLVLPIPESMAAQIHLRDPVNVHVQALNQDIVGKVSRFADSLDLQTRTMETEIDFDNANGKLIPGMYAETTVVLSEKKDALLVPIEAVSQNGNDATVLAVNPQNIVEEHHVKLGIQDKSRIQIISGLTEQDRVVIGNRSQFRNGEKITPHEASAQTSEPGGAN
jgi:RND family efflux transporter MFP subunit